MAAPKVLLLDEPSMGLAPILVEQIFDIIKTINEQGTTVLLVEQNALMALAIANRGYILQTGEIVLADEAAAARQEPGASGRRTSEGTDPGRRHEPDSSGPGPRVAARRTQRGRRRRDRHRHPGRDHQAVGQPDTGARRPATPSRRGRRAPPASGVRTRRRLRRPTTTSCSAAVRAASRAGSIWPAGYLVSVRRTPIRIESTEPSASPAARPPSGRPGRRPDRPSASPSRRPPRPRTVGHPTGRDCDLDRGRRSPRRRSGVNTAARRDQPASDRHRPDRRRDRLEPPSGGHAAPSPWPRPLRGARHRRRPRRPTRLAAGRPGRYRLDARTSMPGGDTASRS